MSSQMATDAARERLEGQKRAAARDFLQSAVMPLIEDVLVKKFCQTMDVIAEENKRIKAREEGLVEALEELEELEELVDLMQGVIDGDYEPDSLTPQPATVALAAYREGGEK